MEKRRVSISASTTFHMVSKRPMHCVSVVPIGISTRTAHHSSWGIPSLRHICCTMYTRHIQCPSAGGGSLAGLWGMPPVATFWSAPSGDGYIRPTCVGVGGVPLPPPPPPMGCLRSPWSVHCVLIGKVQGGVSSPSDRGSGSPPWPFPYPSGRGWATVRTRADTNVSVWHTLYMGTPLLWKTLDTHWSLLLPPTIASGNPP